MTENDPARGQQAARYFDKLADDLEGGPAKDSDFGDPRGGLRNTLAFASLALERLDPTDREAAERLTCGARAILDAFCNAQEWSESLATLAADTGRRWRSRRREHLD